MLPAPELTCLHTLCSGKSAPACCLPQAAPLQAPSLMNRGRSKFSTSPNERLCKGTLIVRRYITFNGTGLWLDEETSILMTLGFGQMRNESGCQKRIAQIFFLTISTLVHASRNFLVEHQHWTITPTVPRTSTNCSARFLCSVSLHLLRSLFSKLP